MSTGKGFLDWYWDKDTYSDCFCGNCETHHLIDTLPVVEETGPVCTTCWAEGCILLLKDEHVEPELLGKRGQKRDLSLLEYLYSNRHSTPFEMGELCIEVKAPLFVFREWHRHRTQSYNEFSARYSVMPNEHYIPDQSRLAPQKSTNKQANSRGDNFGVVNRGLLQNGISDIQNVIYDQYDTLLESGVPKEVARINTPVSRYSKMRAKTDIRNWLAFLSLRMEMGAQWEIRMYANAVASILKVLFPRTFDLFLEWDLLGERFSRTEMRLLRELISDIETSRINEVSEKLGLSVKQRKALANKFNTNKEDLYKEVLDKL